MAVSNNNRFIQQIQAVKVHPNLIYAVLIIGALLFFEVFNFSTTDFALRDLLGDLKFMGIPWATTLAIAFCAIDFAGIARLFTPETGRDEPKEIWYLFGAWLLAATMNASLTWWGVSMAIANHTILSTSIVEAGTIMRVVPIFIAILVWVIRVLVIGTLSVAGEHIFQSPVTLRSNTHLSQNTSRPRFETGNLYPEAAKHPNASSRSPLVARPVRGESKNYSMTSSSNKSRNQYEPTYVSMEAEFSNKEKLDSQQVNEKPQSSGGRYFS